jgi:DNA-binding response OmpR family regulator
MMARPILLLEGDLFFSEKIRTALRHLGYATIVTRTLAQFVEQLGAEFPALVIIGTGSSHIPWEEAVRRAKAAGYPVLVFSSHVDLAAQAAARQAGADRVVANAKLAADLPRLIGQMLGDGAPGCNTGDDTPA